MRTAVRPNSAALQNFKEEDPDKRKSAPTAATVKGARLNERLNIITPSKLCQFKIITAELRTCSYPNIAAEYYSTNIHISTFVDCVNVTGALFQAFLDGKTELTRLEFKAVWELLNNVTKVIRSINYLMSPVLSLTKPKHYHKVLVAYRAYEKARRSKHADDLANLLHERLLTLDELLKRRYCTRAYYNRLLTYVEDVNHSERSAARKAQRRDITRKETSNETGKGGFIR